LADHLKEYHDYLIGKGATQAHADLTHARVARLIELGRARRVSDLTPSRIQTALKMIRDEGKSLRTVHHYVRVVKAYSRWLWRDGRAREHALAHLIAPNPDPDRRRVRRALTPEDLARLVAAAKRGPLSRGLTGTDRAALYLVAAGTGFRRGELASLTPESFDLDADPPTVTVKAAYSKRRRTDTQPIRSDLVEALRPWLARKPAKLAVFGRLTKHTAVMMRHDLEAAGVPAIDASEQVADFHALRHTYITALVKSPTPVKVVQTLARHSTPTLTLGTYAHVGVYDLTAALDALPDLTPAAPSTESQELRATGTDMSRIDNRFALPLPYSAQGSGRDVMVTDGSADTSRSEYDPVVMMRETPEIKASDASCGILTGGFQAEEEGFEPSVPGTGTPVFVSVLSTNHTKPPGEDTCLILNCRACKSLEANEMKRLFDSATIVCGFRSLQGFCDKHNL
jgi:integrase